VAAFAQWYSTKILNMSQDIIKGKLI